MTVNKKNEPTRIREVFDSQRSRAILLRKEPISRRIERLKLLRDWINRNRTSLKTAAYKDMAKPAVEFEAIEIMYVMNEIRTALKNIDQWAKPKKVDATFDMLGTRSEICYEALGVCLIISPWNYPFSLAVGPMVSAIASGNTVIIKPSEYSVCMSSEIERMVKELYEEDHVAVVQGDAQTSKELLTYPFNHIFFTGSPGVGKTVMKAAAENLASITLELGGKCPAIVTSSASIKESAQRIVVGKFVNAGQTCIAPDYVLVDKKVAPAFVEELIYNIQERFMDKESRLPFTDYVKIVSPKHYNRLKDLVQNALDQGWKMLFSGAHKEEESIFSPIVITGNNLQARLMTEEIFGPVLPIIEFSSLDESIDLINGLPKPLGLYVFSRQHKEQDKILKETSSGGVCINDCGIQFLHHKLPFGGVNQSGIGKAHSHAGFLSFSNVKPVLRQRSGFTSVRLFYPPYSNLPKRLLDLLFNLFYK